jgi:Flp pilus assembly protein TadB
MRDDSYVPSWLVDLALLAIVIGAAVLVFRDRVDDSAWEERWRALSPADRTRIAAAARSGTLLADPEEMELAAGYARRERRRRAPYAFRATFLGLFLGAALIIAGVAHDSAALLVVGAVVLLLTVIGLLRESQAADNLRETASRDTRH